MRTVGGVAIFVFSYGRTDRQTDIRTDRQTDATNDNTPRHNMPRGKNDKNWQFSGIENISRYVEKTEQKMKNNSLLFFSKLLVDNNDIKKILISLPVWLRSFWRKGLILLLFLGYHGNRR